MEKMPKPKQEKNPKVAMLGMLLALFSFGGKTEAKNYGELDQKKVDRVEEIFSDGKVDSLEERELKEILEERFSLIFKEREKALEDLEEKIDEISSSVIAGGLNEDDREKAFTDAYLDFQSVVSTFRAEEQELRNYVRGVFNSETILEIVGDFTVDRLKDDYKEYADKVEGSLAEIDKTFLNLIPQIVTESDLEAYMIKAENEFPEALNYIASHTNFSNSEDISRIAKDTHDQEDFEKALSFLDEKEKLKIMKDLGVENHLTASGAFSRFALPLEIYSVKIFFTDARNAKYIDSETIDEMEARYGLLTKIFDRMVTKHLIDRDSII